MQLSAEMGKDVVIKHLKTGPFELNGEEKQTFVVACCSLKFRRNSVSCTATSRSVYNILRYKFNTSYNGPLVCTDQT